MGKTSKKVKKQNAAKLAKKVAKEEKYSANDYLDKADECMDEFNFPLAKSFCERALKVEPNNIRALETAGSVLIELGEMDSAKDCFSLAITVQPEEGHEKYMCMGQLLTGSDAVSCFHKGIELMKTILQQDEAAAAAEKSDVMPRDIARAYCNIAEIYLTDECFEDDADEKCKGCLQEAAKVDPEYPECHHLLASFYISKESMDEAKEAMEKGLALWLPQWKEEVQKPDGEDVADLAQSCSIGYPERIHASKLLIELQQYEEASEILEMLLEEEDEIVETWYLLGWVNYLQGEDYYNNARHYLQQAHKVNIKAECGDEGIVKHIDELLKELGPEEGEEEEEGENGEMRDIESDDEEQEDKNAMEH